MQNLVCFSREEETPDFKWINRFVLRVMGSWKVGGILSARCELYGFSRRCYLAAFVTWFKTAAKYIMVLGTHAKKLVVCLRYILFGASFKTSNDETSKPLWHTLQRLLPGMPRTIRSKSLCVCECVCVCVCVLSESKNFNTCRTLICRLICMGVKLGLGH